MSNKTPKISIITINYNNNEGLIKTILSVINQTYKDFEYIIIDGGSTDESLVTIEKYKGHIDYWVSEKDNGIYDALNKGIEVAKGDYINFMNSGDSFFTLTILEEIQHQFDSNISILYGNSFYFNQNGYDRVEKTPSKLKFSHFWTSGINHQASFIKRDLFNKYFMYDISYKICADWEFFLYVLFKRNESYLHLQKVICFYDFSGISAISENLDLYYSEREIILKKHFPLFYDDYTIMGELNDRRVQNLLYIKKFKPAWKLIKGLSNFLLIFLPKKNNKT